MKSEIQNSFMPFFVPGMPRSGTTFLFHVFRNHPGVCLPNRKEVDFFNSHWDAGRPWFEELYKHREEGQICGDISPSYFLTDDFCEKLPQDFAGSKIILGVRDPVEYVISFYRQRETFDFKLPPFREFLSSYHADFGGRDIHVGFAENQVVDMVEKIRTTFGKDVLLFSFDEIKNDPLGLVIQLEEFLGLSPYFNEGNVATDPVNASGRKNNKILTYLLSRPLLVSTAEKLFSRAFLQSAHSFFYKATAGKSATKASQIEEGDLAFAREVLGEQCRHVESLFAEAPLVLGDGSVFSRRNHGTPN